MKDLSFLLKYAYDALCGVGFQSVLWIVQNFLLIVRSLNNRSKTRGFHIMVFFQILANQESCFCQFKNDSPLIVHRLDEHEHFRLSEVKIDNKLSFKKHFATICEKRVPATVYVRVQNVRIVTNCCTFVLAQFDH